MCCENLLIQLRPEIEKKCEEIKIKRKEQRLKRNFIISAILLFSLPTLLILSGFSILGSLAAVSVLGMIMLIVNAPTMIFVYQGRLKYAYR